MNKKKADQIIEILEQNYGGVKCGLEYTTPYELLISTILSAQCTDVRVNKVTRELYKIANTPKDILKLGVIKLEGIIRPCGLSKTKSQNITKTSRIILDEYDGEVPSTFNELTSLPGVGRKTANVVLSNAFGVPAIAVDTHVQRVSNRIGLAHSKDVVKTEEMLKNIINEDKWSKAHHMLIWHGRQICTARSPKCGICPLLGLCEYVDKHIK